MKKFSQPNVSHRFSAVIAIIVNRKGGEGWSRKKMNEIAHI